MGAGAQHFIQAPSKAQPSALDNINLIGGATIRQVTRRSPRRQLPAAGWQLHGAPHAAAPHLPSAPRQTAGLVAGQATGPTVWLAVELRRLPAPQCPATLRTALQGNASKKGPKKETASPTRAQLQQQAKDVGRTKTPRPPVAAGGDSD
jgi:hypothetical protein